MHWKQREKIYLKGMKIIESCKTRDHCVVAHNWLTLAEKLVIDQQAFNLNEAYLTKILQVTGVIE